MKSDIILRSDVPKQDSGTSTNIFMESAIDVINKMKNVDHPIRRSDAPEPSLINTEDLNTIRDHEYAEVEKLEVPEQRGKLQEWIETLPKGQRLSETKSLQDHMLPLEREYWYAEVEKLEVPEQRGKLQEWIETLPEEQRLSETKSLQDHMLPLEREYWYAEARGMHVKDTDTNSELSRTIPQQREVITDWIGTLPLGLQGSEIAFLNNEIPRLPNMMGVWT